MFIKIIKPGILTTIQDLGRRGYGAVGIGPGGAMDFFAATAANLLAGNDEKCPLLEMHFPAAEIFFDIDTLVGITGANVEACVNNEPVTIWQPIIIKQGQILTFKKCIEGARIYLAIYGGLHADSWLNSYSTHLKLKTGGFQGRPLLKEDVIFLKKKLLPVEIENIPEIASLVSPVYQPPATIRCITGPEWDLLNNQSKTIFSRSPFIITTQSDRMGYRLKGDGLVVQNSDQLMSSPVDSGTIQLLPDGQLIVLMADHPTTGGYHRIAGVISADLPKLAQAAVRSELHFIMTDIENAEEVLLSVYQRLENLRNICVNHYAAYRHQL